ncbi:LysR family transcriptional regulator [Brevundimonas sp.]|uniref:LysR family transcriptional regulator n=1 Tax=Brevundimonas sp. TaxID=1871086 RepID=UPI00286BF069|nr:LysR family transcriptional regulator [Brevundimonas sp.]
MQERIDWRSLRFDWNHARAFLATAELGSLSRAADALDLSQPTLSRQVEALQQALGVVLFERAGRGFVLTHAGHELLDHVREMGEAASRTSLAADGRTQTLQGSVAISASDVYATSLLPDVVADITQQHPGLSIEIVVANDRTDLRRREADIAVRSYPTEHRDLIVKRLGSDQGGFYASNDWLSRHPVPVTPADLESVDMVGYPGQNWVLKGLRELGFPISERNMRIVSESHLAQWAMVRAGAGVGIMTLRVGDADSTVQRLLPELKPLSFPVWLVTHRDLRTSLKVRAVYDALAARLSFAD